MRNILVILVALAAIGSLFPQPGEAVDDRLTPQLALARVTASEAGWSEDLNDMAAIHHVLLRGAARRRSTGRESWQASYLSFASRYSRRLLTGVGTIQRPWLRDLSPDGSEPEGWPSERWVSVTRDGVRVLERRPHASWGAYRGRWMALYARAGEQVQMRLNDWDEWSPCAEEPDHWGGSMDRDRADRMGLVEVDCGDTANDFYRWPDPNDIEVDVD